MDSVRSPASPAADPWRCNAAERSVGGEALNICTPMASVVVSLGLSPAELLCRLPRGRGTFLLDGGGDDSWGSGEALLGCEPTSIISIGAERHGAPSQADPFAVLEQASRGEPCAGVFCALGYDLGRWVEALGPPPRDTADLPVLFAAVHPWVLAYSYRDRRYELRSPHLGDSELSGVARRLHEAARRPLPPSGGPREAPPIRSNFSRPEYLAAVARVLEYIGAGDVYQVNLSQRFTAATAEAPARFFARMLARHPAPYSAFLDGGDWSLVSNSPECFLARDGDAVSTFPIKGTRPRGASPDGDKAMAGALLSSVKDRAEHLMIVDLERNDLGRVCRFGSIDVRSLARLRSFASVHHLESEVAGLLAPGTSLAALLRAAFPGGSITGAPKVRAMQIIDEIETLGRGFYTGAIGFIRDATLRLNIAIRTATVRGGEVSYHAGGGIVADSDPLEEYEETQLKARAFFDTLETSGE